MSMVFSALGSLTFLSSGISPDAENVMSKKTTIVTKKSIILVRLRPADVARCPLPETLSVTNLSGMWYINRRPGS
jgi:hypothetical protein